MNIHAHGLQLVLSPRGKANAEGWATLQAQVTVPGFSGDFEASIEIENLVDFAERLNRMNRSLGELCDAVLEGIEPGLFVALSSNKQGQISGRYRFENQFGVGNGPTLTGSFTLDQTYLAGLERSVRALVKDLSNAHAT